MALEIRKMVVGLPWWLSGEESTCQCGRHGFDPRSRKISRVSEELNPSAAATEPAHPSVCSATAGAMRREARAPQPEKAHVQQERPSRVENKQILKNLKTLQKRDEG